MGLLSTSAVAANGSGGSNNNLDDDGVLTVITVNMFAGTFLFLLFCVLRRKFPDFYHPRNRFRGPLYAFSSVSQPSVPAAPLSNPVESSSSSPILSPRNADTAFTQYASFNSPSKSLDFEAGGYTASTPSSYASSSSIHVPQPTIYTSLLSQQRDEVAEIASSTDMFDWIRLIDEFFDEEFLEYNGEDAYMYFYVFRKMNKLLFLIAAIGIVIILPINLTGENVGETMGIDKITMASLGRGSSRLWAHFIVTVIFSLSILYVIWISWVRYLEIEQRFRRKKRESNFTLMISELPTIVNSRVSISGNNKGNSSVIWNDETLYDYAARLFAPFQIQRARLAFHSPLLRSLLDQEKELKTELEKVNEEAELDNKEPMVKDPTAPFWPPFGQKKMISARDYYQEKLSEVSEKIKIESSLLEHASRFNPLPLPPLEPNESESHIEKISNVGKKAHRIVHQEASAVVKGFTDAILPSAMQKARLTSVGFITFVSMKGAHLCRQALLSSDPSKVVAVMAPLPEAINWEYLHIHKRQRMLRKLGVVAGSTALIIFWSALVALLAQMFNVKMLQEYIPAIVNAINSLPSGVSGAIFSFLPTLATSVLMFLLIPILTYFVTKEAYYDKTEADRSLLRKYFVFLLFNVLLAASITPQIPSLVKSLEQGVTCDKDNQLVCLFLVIAETLGSTLPQSSFFFVNYVLNAVGLGCMLTALRVGPFVVHLIKMKFSKTTIDKENSYLPGPFNYAIGYGINLSFFSIVLTFSVLVPIISVLGFFYFFLIRFVTKFNVAVVYQPNYERGGRLTTTIFPLLFVCILTFQFTMLGIFVVYGGSSQSTGMLILIMISSIIYYLMHARYSKASQFLPLDIFVRDEEVQFDGDIYLQDERKVKNSIFEDQQPIDIIEE